MLKVKIISLFGYTSLLKNNFVFYPFIRLSPSYIIRNSNIEKIFKSCSFMFSEKYEIVNQRMSYCNFAKSSLRIPEKDCTKLQNKRVYISCLSVILPSTSLFLWVFLCDFGTKVLKRQSPCQSLMNFILVKWHDKTFFRTVFLKLFEILSDFLRCCSKHKQARGTNTLIRGNIWSKTSRAKLKAVSIKE